MNLVAPHLNVAARVNVDVGDVNADRRETEIQVREAAVVNSSDERYYLIL